MDFSQKDAAVALLEAGDLKPADELTSADVQQAPAPRASKLRLEHPIHVVISQWVVFTVVFLLTLSDVQEGPWRRLQMAVVAVAYVPAGAIVWYCRQVPRHGAGPWKKLAAALVVAFGGIVIGRFTGSTMMTMMGNFFFMFVYVL